MFKPILEVFSEYFLIYIHQGFLLINPESSSTKMRVGPEIKRGAGRMCEGAFDFLAFFGSFWGNAKKNRTFEVKLPLNFAVFFC